MIEEDYVSFETAKLLKEKGFKGEGEHFYEDDKITNFIDYWFRITPIQRYEAIEAPTLQMAMKWLREEHKLFIEISLSCDREDKNSKIFDASIFNIENQRYKKLSNIQGYEQACEMAIKYSLENLV